MVFAAHLSKSTYYLLLSTYYFLLTTFQLASADQHTARALPLQSIHVAFRKIKGPSVYNNKVVPTLMPTPFMEY
jgi:hypothetical protein